MSCLLCHRVCCSWCSSWPTGHHNIAVASSLVSASDAAARQAQQVDSSSKAAGSRRAIEVSRSIAAARAAESSLPEGLFTDPFAAQLLGGQQQQQHDEQKQLLDVIATRYIDESLLNAMAATNVNSIQSGDYRQVWLTQPRRLGKQMNTSYLRTWQCNT